mmetsp:Transcript_106503/g.333983  ORF Transcript_106503/g.333983 Transcript_106503/m.333983 type:complete len:252 (-) Transcript_106503:230-985(-)
MLPFLFGWAGHRLCAEGRSLWWYGGSRVLRCKGPGVSRLDRWRSGRQLHFHHDDDRTPSNARNLHTTPYFDNTEFEGVDHGVDHHCHPSHEYSGADHDNPDQHSRVHGHAGADHRSSDHDHRGPDNHGGASDDRTGRVSADHRGGARGVGGGRERRGAAVSSGELRGVRSQCRRRRQRLLGQASRRDLQRRLRAGFRRSGDDVHLRRLPGDSSGLRLHHVHLDHDVDVADDDEFHDHVQHHVVKHNKCYHN